MTETTTAPRLVRTKEGEEAWETTTGATIYLGITNPRGHSKVKKFGGKPGSRVRISTTDREINQDAITNEDSDPFSNGLLKRLDKDQNEDESTATDQALDTEELMALFGKSGNAFQSAVRALNERNVRRLRAIAEDVDASASQISFLDEHITEHYRIEGSRESYDELVRDGVIKQA